MPNVPKKLHILQMGKFFLYLPVYYAHSRRFFGRIPDEVNIVIHEPLPPFTDTATFDSVLDRSDKNRDFVMCITDPTQVLSNVAHDGHRPAVLAAIVTNGSFWAVDHRTKTVHGLRDLGSFDRIIAYKKGTTSYNIAARIARSSSHPLPLDERIRVVRQGEELTLLRHPTEGANAVALSPDILAIEDMEGRNEVFIELALGETDEYSDVLVAALVTRQEFVEHNRPLVEGVVAGIQEALTAIHRLDPDVLRFAQSYFHYADRAEGAIRKAVSSGVVPGSVIVAKGHWLRSVRAYFEAENGGEVWSSEQEQLANSSYKDFVEPYFAIAQSAVAFALQHGPSQQYKTLQTGLRSYVAPAFGYCIFGVAVVLAAHFLGPAQAVVLLVLASFGLPIMRTVAPRTSALVRGLLFFVGVASMILPWIPHLTLSPKAENVLMSLGGGLVTGMICNYMFSLGRRE